MLLQKGVVATSPQRNYTLIEGTTSHTYAALSRLPTGGKLICNGGV